MNSREKRLTDLLDLVLSGAQTDAESDQLRRLLDEHEELWPAVIEQLRTHSLLEWELRTADPSLGTVPNDRPAGAASRRAHGGRGGAAQPAGAHDWLAASRAAWAVAVVVLVALTWAVVHRLLPDDNDLPAAVAKIVRMNDAQFNPGSDALASGQLLVPGGLDLLAGRIAIEYRSGVQMEVSGPARLEIPSERLVQLTLGKATAQVPRWARGFTIKTPDVEVVDLGTRFGVATHNQGTTDVVVFEGEVDLNSAGGGELRLQRRLAQGEAARIDRSGQIERIFQVHGDWYENAWSTEPSQSDGCAIATVSDNFGATKSLSYYHVIPAGFAEDCVAYVDRPHQWNGLTPDGLPEILRNADYVRTVNDYRYRGELSLRVEFARDATLLVLFDNRVRVPDWLRDQFEDTGVDVGLDEDAWHGNSAFTVETGPGLSIDNVFSVWQRPCHRGEVFVLGSMGGGGEARAMYGIAAVATDGN